MKTKLGISVGLLGAATYLAAMFGGYVVLLLLVGYILLFEQDEWLKKTAVKAFAVLACFSLLDAFVGFVPNILGLIYDISGIFGDAAYGGVLSNLVDVVQDVIGIVEKILFLVLMFKALKRQTVKINIVDSLIEKEYGAAVTVKAEVADVKFCGNCGKKMASSATFCPNCGQKG